MKAPMEPALQAGRSDVSQQGDTPLTPHARHTIA